MEFGINFNGDMDFKLIKEHSILAEKAKFNYIWIGDSPFFAHSFSVLPLVSESTKKIKIGSGIISPVINRCLHIKQAFRTLKESYGEKYVIALAPGDRRALEKLSIGKKNVIEKIEKCAAEIKKELKIKVFIGASGPKLIEKASSQGYPLLLNYGCAPYLNWALKHRKKEVYCAAYAPSLIFNSVFNSTPRKLEKRLLIASAIVLAGSNKQFQEEFGLEERADKVRKILEKEQYAKLEEYKSLLLEKFSISGSLEEVKERCEELKRLGIAQVIFATPLGLSKEAILSLRGIISEVS